ncbi:hypothetical protein NR402_03795 [Acidithiobacillus ferrooxidans]|uniref:hypothetical protein n=1 Tax=Acidithiobacillus ferrooxidans TaxID=920 RepID=UPI00194278BA|nr:hypothetical protein [Acidithiobacillus ferrooxidans]MCR2829405.1 hypothetical protein [Acidithiobacillus ferrooxidans]
MMRFVRRYRRFLMVMAGMGMAATKPALPTMKRRLALIAPAPLLWLLLLCGTWAFFTPAASAQINFAFSVGDGVNAYYLATASSFIYAYDRFYYDWAGNGWLYSTDYIGPWYPLPPYSVLPLPLEYGPPPPMVPYHPYFVWWRARVAPWYQVNHPAWWFRHRMDLDHYRVWRARVIPRYRGRPFYRGPMRPIFRRPYPVRRIAGPVMRGRVIHPVVRPVFRPGFRQGASPVFHPPVRRLPARPFVRRPIARPRPIYHPVQPQRFHPVVRRPTVRRVIRPARLNRGRKRQVLAHAGGLGGQHHP